MRGVDPVRGKLRGRNVLRNAAEDFVQPNERKPFLRRDIGYDFQVRIEVYAQAAHPADGQYVGLDQNEFRARAADRRYERKIVFAELFGRDQVSVVNAVPDVVDADVEDYDVGRFVYDIAVDSFQKVFGAVSADAVVDHFGRVLGVEQPQPFFHHRDVTVAQIFRIRIIPIRIGDRISEEYDFHIALLRAIARYRFILT